MPPVIRISGLSVAYHGVNERGVAMPGRHELARVRYGKHALLGADTSALSLDVPLRQLDKNEVFEVWTCDEACELDERFGFRLSRADSWLFGGIELRDVSPDSVAPGDTSLSDTTRSAYEHLLRLVADDGKHLLRVWNTVPDALAGPSDFLRYMEFCQGRAQAFESHFGAGFEAKLCAFSAVGSSRGPQCLYFLACKDAGEALENPRQVSAYRYPARYGPRSPSFARALRGPHAAGDALFLSGTASILGHESMHVDQVLEQTRETLRNLTALLDTNDEMALLKVYLRREEDLDEVRALLVAEFGVELPTLWLRADICRPELLVEIEGVAHPR